MKDFKIYKNTYYDSVTLMSLSAKLMREQPFRELVVLMATSMNKEMIDAVGLFDESMRSLTPNDLIIAMETDDPDLSQTWVDLVFQTLNAKKTSAGTETKNYRTIHQAKEDIPEANVCVVSVPGAYAASEAFNALHEGMHVMLFSDNVTVEDEIALKDLAIEKDLLLMGPDCGTSILNGKGLCFANEVRRGHIGLIAASGTGLQEVTVIIDRFGGGISQAIGVGGRDLSEKVGGRMLLKALKDLQNDDETHVIALISKPPHPSVEEKILAELHQTTKPIVVCFLDTHPTMSLEQVTFVSSLADCAFQSLKYLGIQVPELHEISPEILSAIESEKNKLSPTQTKLKGLFCGGTLTAEALSIVREYVGHVTSNVAKKPHEKMHDVFVSQGHNLVDLGDDVFTNGRPHPMIEPTIRLDRLLLEAKNPETAVILLDFELGYGSHDDPVGITMDTIRKAKRIAEKEGRHLVFVAYVCGTNKDKQNLEISENALRDEKVIVANTNASACYIAAQIVKEVGL